MHRDKLSARVGDIEWFDTGQQPSKPTFIITFDGPASDLRSRFQRPGSEQYTPADIDIFYRPHPSARPAASSGVLGLSDGMTGDYLLELNLGSDVIETLVAAVRQYASAAEAGPRYSVELWAGDHQLGTFDKETLLVFNADGELVRQRSLPPDGLEI